MDRREQGRTPASVHEAADTYIVETIYEIRNASGHLVARHVRRDKPDGKKDVLWRQPDGAWGLNGTPLADIPLYGAELVADLGADELIVVTEGEKARDALEAAGLPAVGTVTGAAGTPGAEALEVLRNRRVCLWPDKDDAGLRHMQRVGEALQGVAAEVLIYTWHESPEKGDAADHPATQTKNPKAVDRLLTELESAPRWKFNGDAEDNETEKSTPTTPSTPICRELPTALAFPVDALPVATRRFVREAAGAIGCPPELVAVPLLATLSAGIGASREVQLKSGWRESTALYMATVSPAGMKKTPAAKEATAPAWRKQRELRQTYLEAREAYEADYRQWEAERRRAAQSGEPSPQPPDRPTMGRTVVEDTTVEALATILEPNPRGVLAAADELTAWARAMNQYKSGKGADRQFWLSVWSNNPIAVDRKGRSEPIIIPMPFVSVVGGIQPSILPELADGREDGLLDRFLWSYPHPHRSRLTDDEISAEATTEYRNLYDKLVQLEMREGANGERVPKVVPLSRDAWEVFKELSDQLQDEMNSPGFPARLEGVWSKMEAYLARLSLILALCRVAERGGEEQVEARDVLTASALVDYFKAHARRVNVGLHGQNTEDLLAKDLAEFLQKNGGEWKNEASVLHKALKKRKCEALPERPDELSKMVYAIARQGTWLKAEPGWKKNAEGKSRRVIHLRFKDGVDGVVGVDQHPY